MEQPAPQTVQSFQQQLSLIQLPNGKQAYAKTIVSNYSWWTFDQTDVFHRELTAYHLLISAQLIPQLLAVDLARKYLLLEAIPTRKPNGKHVPAFVGRLISLLKTLKASSGQALSACSFSQLADLYWHKGQAAQVHGWLLEELTSLLTKWSQADAHPLSFVHGDLHFGNLLHDGESIKLIDFEEAIQSHPVIDATSLSWDILDCFGQQTYRYFNRLYRAEFGTEVLDLGEWKRFCQLRNWIVGRYLEQCCAPAVQEKAHRFIVAGEPTSKG